MYLRKEVICFCSLRTTTITITSFNVKLLMNQRSALDNYFHHGGVSTAEN